MIKSMQIWYKIWYASEISPENPCNSSTFYASGFIVGKSRTSRMLSLFVSSITKRSKPKPRPPVGGIIYAVLKPFQKLFLMLPYRCPRDRVLKPPAPSHPYGNFDVSCDVN